MTSRADAEQRLPQVIAWGNHHELHRNEDGQWSVMLKLGDGEFAEMRTLDKDEASLLEDGFAAALRATPPTTKPSGEAVEIESVGRGFDWQPNDLHIPTVTVRFKPNDWKGRDAFANSLAPQPTSKEPK